MTSRSHRAPCRVMAREEALGSIYDDDASRGSEVVDVVAVVVVVVVVVVVAAVESAGAAGWRGSCLLV